MGRLKDAIATRKLLLADGAWGTHLMSAGLEPENASADSWNLTHPHTIRELAGSYADAGAQIISSNTFGANSFRYAVDGAGQSLSAVNTAGVQLARAGAGPDVLIAGSMGPTGLKDIAARAEAIAQAYGAQAAFLEAAGADFLLLETMTSPEEACIALDAIRRQSALEVVCSYAFRRDPSGSVSTWSGAPADTAITRALAAGATMTGVNCYPADETLVPLVAQLHSSHPAETWWLKPNAGSPPSPACPKGYTHPITNLAPALQELHSRGVRILGGCCGTTPTHIATLRAALCSQSNPSANT